MELKHLAAYLPYELSGLVKWEHKNEIHKVKLYGILVNDLQIDNPFGGFDYCSYTDFKPILSPLSDLTKEIEHNGEKFVPVVKIKELYGEYFIIFDGVNLWIDDKCSLGIYEVTRINDLIQKLLEWNFDVFDLIEKGEAIDINTLDL